MAEHVVVGMSGGVDSSVAAWLLKEQGVRVTGLFMKNWEDDDREDYCATKQDLIDAAAVADRIGVELEAVNFSAEYMERVFSEFLREYRAGRTPNPDVLCNAEIKFKAFLDHAVSLGAEMIATGHYAQVRERGGRFELLKAEDGTKDQSYFLYRLNQQQLAKTLFPLGRITKREVRKIAADLKLPTAEKKDSTGLCFIGERPFREFLSRYLPPEPGKIETSEGEAIGEHAGLMYYTIGQRQGLGIGGAKTGEEAPWYVVGKNIARNVLTVVQGREHSSLYRDRLRARNLNWIAGHEPRCNWVYTAKIRYRQEDAPCSIAHLDAESCEIEFAQPQWAVAPGQSVVVYESRVCLGGGIIE
jgi:tRNA-specific 2-thiouridylase